MKNVSPLDLQSKCTNREQRAKSHRLQQNDVYANNHITRRTMRPYAHLTPFEREKLMSLHNNGKGISETARCLGRHKSTISPESSNGTLFPDVALRLWHREHIVPAERSAIPGESSTTSRSPPA
uniref:helix-turn-helix domain-containing protein n=1 Tax=Pyramidobacter porci TaxID=2605789 RepID=UPI002DD84F16|nr:helix-turn-helix domain-containing protein [Pyramidobacter porci]